MSRPRLPRCPAHQDAASGTCSRCGACCALRGTTPSPRTSGSTGAERGHPERAARRAALAQGEEVTVRLTREEVALLDAQRGTRTRAEYLGALVRGEAQAMVSPEWLAWIIDHEGALGPWEPDGDGWVRRWARIPGSEQRKPSRVYLYPEDGEWGWETDLDADSEDTPERARLRADAKVNGWAVLLHSAHAAQHYKRH